MHLPGRIYTYIGLAGEEEGEEHYGTDGMMG